MTPAAGWLRTWLAFSVVWTLGAAALIQRPLTHFWYNWWEGELICRYPLHAPPVCTRGWSGVSVACLVLAPWIVSAFVALARWIERGFPRT